ncbi:uncharacterized protein EURHEDRAFT_275273 [Aspergillus ruber CBS 135680]|uniref:Uncharacterized protein n=1 Tax=Aspergillus ruber (strain CBS 135680) TaxID=1388766 RepID=A0A017SN75_ASPRC|nr:uncharacterized protein EURHEDRAFT_275273 [Aspergillus ruber CBS 135680]EYE98261.1 hypothetical protein EURHEDRAFT_275273 [Aspergillus ruber CBS 135680]
MIMIRGGLTVGLKTRSLESAATTACLGRSQLSNWERFHPWQRMRRLRCRVMQCKMPPSEGRIYHPHSFSHFA